MRLTCHGQRVWARRDKDTAIEEFDPATRSHGALLKSGRWQRERHTLGAHPQRDYWETAKIARHSNGDR